MRNLAKRFGGVLRALHRDQRGANMVEYVLIIAAIALPLLGVLLWYRQAVAEWLVEWWNNTRNTPNPATP